MRTTRWGRSVVMAMGVIVFTAAESTAQRYLPPGHRAGSGECRVWIEGVPPGHQPAPFRCDRGRRIAWAPVVREAYLDWYLSRPWASINVRLDWDRYGVRAAFFDVAAILEFERYHRVRYVRAGRRIDRYWDRYYDGYRDARWRTAYRNRFLRDVRQYRWGRSARAVPRVRAPRIRAPRVRAPRVDYRRGDRDRFGDRYEDRRDRAEDRREEWRDRNDDRREDRWERDDDRRGPPGSRGRGNARGNNGNGRGNGRGG